MTPDYYSYEGFDHSRTPGVRLVDFGADFISHFEYKLFNEGWRNGDDTVPTDLLVQLLDWKSENSLYLMNFLSTLEGPTSFMCYLGIDRSGDIATLASYLGVDVVDNSSTPWGQVAGRHFGAAFFPRNNDEHHPFALIDEWNQVYLGDGYRPSNNLVIVLDPHYLKESKALDAVLDSLRGTEGLLDVSLLLLTESAAKILVMDYCEVPYSPISLCAQLAEYERYEMAVR